MDRFLAAAGLCLASLSCLLAPGLSAQTDSVPVVVSGTVVDPMRKPIEGAEVRVPGTGISTLTSADGKFRLNAPMSGTLLVQFRRPGYSAQILRVTDHWSGTVLLVPGTFELPEIQVTARYAKPAKYAETAKYDDFFRRRRQGFGTFIDRDEIDRRGATRAAEILQGKAGIRVDMRPAGASDGTIVSFVRCDIFPPKINVYVDGRRLMPDQSVMSQVQSQPTGAGRGVARSGEDERTVSLRKEARAMIGTLLDRVPAGDIELIEIFRGPSELPPEFSDDNCGAIAIWTRQGGS